MLKDGLNDVVLDTWALKSLECTWVHVVMCGPMTFVCRADVLLYGATGKSNRTRRGMYNLPTCIPPGKDTLGS